MRASRRTVVVLLLAVCTARGQGADTVLIAGTCTPPGAAADDVTRILAAELSPAQVAPLSTSNVSGRTAVLAIDDCTDSPPSARISVWSHGERRQRVVLLADTAKGTESRTLALALAEALRDPRVTELASPAPPPWIAPPREPAPAVATPREQSSPRSAPDAHRAPSPRAALLFRFMPASATPALGVAGALEWERLGAGLMVIGARKSATLGAVGLLALAAQASFDALYLTRTTTLRAQGELGAALAVASPTAAADGHTRAALHAGLFGGVKQVVPLGAGFDLHLFAGAGYVSSLNADADGRRIAGLSGGVVTVEAGVRF